jgi:hypothetical protein
MRIPLSAVLVSTLLSLPIAALGSTLRAGSMTVNGLAVKNLVCEIEGGGLMASMVIVSGLAGKKAQLYGCAPGGAEPEASWTYNGAKIATASAKGAPAKVTSCVARVLKTVKASLKGSCSAQIVLKKK